MEKNDRISEWAADVSSATSSRNQPVRPSSGTLPNKYSVLPPIGGFNADLTAQLPNENQVDMAQLAKEEVEDDLEAVEALKEQLRLQQQLLQMELELDTGSNVRPMTAQDVAEVDAKTNDTLNRARVLQAHQQERLNTAASSLAGSIRTGSGRSRTAAGGRVASGRSRTGSGRSRDALF